MSLSALRAIDWFSDLDGADLETLASACLTRRFRRHETIVREGEAADRFFAILEGRVKVFKISQDAREQVLGVFGPGQTFAEAAVFERETYPAWAEALEDSALLSIPRDAIVQLIERRPEVALRMLGAFSRKLREMTRLVASLSLDDVEARLLEHVAWLCRRQIAEPAAGSVVVLDTDKGTLAARLGTIPETLSRTFRSLRERGILRVDGSKVTIDDPAALPRANRDAQRRG